MANLKTGFTRKQRTPDFLKNEHFLPNDTHMHVCVSGDKKCSFSRKFGGPCFLVTPVSRFALLLFHRRYRNASNSNLVKVRYDNQKRCKKSITFKKVLLPERRYLT